MIPEGRSRPLRKALHSPRSFTSVVAQEKIGESLDFYGKNIFYSSFNKMKNNLKKLVSFAIFSSSKKLMQLLVFKSYIDFFCLQFY